MNRYHFTRHLSVIQNGYKRGEYEAEKTNEIAFYWEGDSPGTDASITYQELCNRTCRLANGMRACGVRKGDRVTIYLPMIIEAVITMLACARIGAVHSVVFAGFSPDALANRIEDCGSSLVVTADQSIRGNRVTRLKDNVDGALAILAAKSPVKSVIVVKHCGHSIEFESGRDVWYHQMLEGQPDHCLAESMGAIHTIYLWIHWEAQRRGAHYWRLHGMGFNYPPVCV